MTSRKRLASGAGLVTSVLVIFESYSSATGGTTAEALLGVGIVFLLDSLVSLYGVRQALYGSAAMSLAVIILVPLLGVPYAAGWLSAIALSVLTLLLDVVAIRSTSKMPEQGNPMNLPVFG
jgi:hypothetical protein